MSNLPKKVSDRLIKEVPRFQSILKNAKDRDVNEADTVTIVNDILSYVFGYDKYSEITSEFCIRNTYCDLAIKVNSQVKFLIEVKAIGLNLKGNHLQQAVNYGANQGVNWVVLTNGINWEIYRIAFEKPINYELVCSLDFLSLAPRKAEEQEKLFLLCKEGLSKAAIDLFHERLQSVNRFVIGAIAASEPVVEVIRRELRKVAEGLKVEAAEIETLLRNEVIKREVFEGDGAAKAKALLKKAAKVKRGGRVVEPLAVVMDVQQTGVQDISCAG